MSRLQRFLSANRRLSARLDARGDVAFYRQYDAIVTQALAELAPGSVVADLGGGRTCSFANALTPDRKFTLVAVDISPVELAHNHTADDVRVGDVTKRIPLEDHSVDLLVSRTLLEHVASVDNVAIEIARVLRPGASTIHLLPCRYAIFAIVARLLPFQFAKRVLHTLIPESRGVVEFDVVYHRGHPRALERTFRRAGFSFVDVKCTWDQASYFHPLFPVFLFVLAYQTLVRLARVRILAAYAIVKATR